MKNTNNKIGLYTEASYSGELESIFTSDIFILFIRKVLLGHEIHIIGRYSENNKLGKYRLINRAEPFYKLSYYKNIPELMLTFPIYILRNFQALNNYIKIIDHLLIAVPSPLSLFFLYLAKKNNKSISIFIRQETIELIKNRYPKSRFPLIFAKFLEWLLILFLKRNPYIPVFTFGSVITDKYKNITSNVIPLADTRYSLSDVVSESNIKKIDWTNEIKLIFVGRIEKGKGIEKLLETLRNLKEFNIILTIVGDGNKKAEYMELAKQYEIQNQISFKGFIPFGEDLLRIIKEHDLFILPSLSEGLPQVILESMACGVLVLASNIGGIPQIVKNDINGFTFNPQSSTELQDLILKLQKSKFDNTLMCINALKTAKEYSCESQAEILLNNMQN